MLSIFEILCFFMLFREIPIRKQITPIENMIQKRENYAFWSIIMLRA
jgi:hypothetical protein